MSKQPAQQPRKYREKKSLGVACCRYNKTGLEVLLVCKRYTYAFNTFVHGSYNNDNQSLINLFNGMTIDEKIDILSLNFNIIWYKIWLDSPKQSSYFAAKCKFETAFLQDEGQRLRKLIGKSVSVGRIWEIPKGQKRNRQETDLQCAIREFGEETGVSKKSYRVLPAATRTHSYVDGQMRYTNIYWIAIAQHSFEPQINFRQQEQIDEICDIRWVNINCIRILDPTGRLEKIIKPIFNYIRKNVH